MGENDYISDAKKKGVIWLRKKVHSCTGFFYSNVKYMGQLWLQIKSSKALITQKTIVLEQKEHVIGQVICYAPIIDHAITEHA